jgi:hypothetical protein
MLIALAHSRGSSPAVGPTGHTTPALFTRVSIVPVALADALDRRADPLGLSEIHRDHCGGAAVGLHLRGGLGDLVGGAGH